MKRKFDICKNCFCIKIGNGEDFVSCKYDALFRNQTWFEKLELPQDCQFKMEYEILSQKGLSDVKETKKSL